MQSQMKTANNNSMQATVANQTGQNQASGYRVVINTPKIIMHNSLESSASTDEKVELTKEEEAGFYESLRKRI